MKSHPLILHPFSSRVKLSGPCYKEVKVVFLDAGYQGMGVKHVEQITHARAQVVKHPWSGGGWVWCAPGQEPPPIPSGFHILPQRWVVERTFAWLGRSRRLSKDYEQNPASSEAWIYITMTRLMLRRLSL